MGCDAPWESPLKRVFVLSSKDLLSVGVAGLLSREIDLEVINKNVSDNSTLVNVMEELHPVILVINESLLITDFSEIFRWLRDFPEWCVIVLNERNNLLHIYEKREAALGNISDLIKIVRNCPSPSF